MKKTITILALVILACTPLPAAVNRIGGVFTGIIRLSIDYHIPSSWNGTADETVPSISLLGGISGTHFRHGRDDAFGIGYTVALGKIVLEEQSREMAPVEGNFLDSYSNVRGLFRHPLGKRFELQLGAGVAFSTTSWSTAIIENLQEKTFTLLSLQAITSAGITWVVTPHFVASFELMTGRCIPNLALITDGDEWVYAGNDGFMIYGLTLLATLSMAYQF